MTVTVQIPEQLIAELSDADEEARSRRFLEAYVLQRFAEGELTAKQVGDALGLSFFEALQFLHDHNAPPDVTPEEHLRQLTDLREITGE